MLKFYKMKTKIFSLLVLAIGLLVNTNAFAQPTGLVTESTRITSSSADKGSTQTYAFASPVSGFKWNIILKSGTGTAPTAPTDTDNSVDITWGSSVVAGDVYQVTAYIIDGNGCYSELYAFEVTITDAVLCIANAAETVGGTAVEAPVGTTTCSLIESNTGGNSSGAPDETIFYLTVKGGVPNATYDTYYSIKDGSSSAVEVTTPVSFAVDASGNGAAKVTLSHASYVALFTNEGSSDKTVTIAATKMVVGLNTSTNVCADPDFDVTVHATPTISF